MAASPASSPRLPSPPPIAEDQSLPSSPGGSLYEEHGQLGLTHSVQHDTGASRRIRPGTRSEDMAEGPPLVELADIDSAFPLTEHLKALHYHHTHPDDGTTRAITPEIAKELSEPPPGTSKEIWLYELARFLIQKTNAIIVALFADCPPCSAQTCAEMRASEWQYLCAVHDPPKSCSAIDYCCHTLDWAANTLASSKMFPSRLGLGSGPATGGADKVLQQQLKEITNIFRRVYRIYAHAWFQHRDMFWRVEGKTGLYIFFKTVCDEYGMIQQENYTIPSEAEGFEPPEDSQVDEKITTPMLLKREEPAVTEEEPAGERVVTHGDTTKRHRHTRSDLGSSVSTIIQEEEEEEEDTQAQAAPLMEDPTDPTKPSMERQTTALKDEDSGVPSLSHMEHDPRPHIDRSTTMRPPHPSETASSDDAASTSSSEGAATEEDDETEITVIETEPSPEFEKSEDQVSSHIVSTEGSVVVTELVEPPVNDSGDSAGPSNS